MKDFKSDDIMPHDALNTKIWSIFDILRSETDDYHVVLFLLSAYKDGIISEKLLKEIQILRTG